MPISPNFGEVLISDQRKYVTLSLRVPRIFQDLMRKDSRRGKTLSDPARKALYRMNRLEGILPALESSHAIAALFDDGNNLRDKTVVVALSGRGDKDVDQLLAMEGDEDASS